MTGEQHLATVHPGVASRVRALLFSCATAKCPMRITQSRRSRELQSAYYAQGRHPLGEVNRLRGAVDLAPIAAGENQRTVTNAPPGTSMHQPWPVLALAVDLCYAFNDPYKEEGHTLTWDEICTLAERAGLTSGRGFKKPDRPHVQWTNGLSDREIRDRGGLTEVA